MSFLWTESKKAEGIPLVKWTTIVLPKCKGGRGIKNPELFSKALAAKYLWRMIENPKFLWGRTMRLKYCPNSSIEEWFTQAVKTHKGGSICWKDFVLAFPLIGNWVAWKIGNERSIHIGQDPWKGSGDNFRLMSHLVTDLVHRGVRLLADVSSRTKEHMGKI